MADQVNVPLTHEQANAGKASFAFLALAIKNIDALFGPGYAIRNPPVLIATLRSVQRAYSDLAKTSGSSPPAGVQS